MVYLESTNYLVEIQGYIDEYRDKRGYVETESQEGVTEETFVRNVTNCDIVVSEVSAIEYLRLQDMISFENEFTVVDTVRNFEQNKMRYSGRNFRLTPIQNNKDKEFYYTGTIPLIKV